jgi:hypothetical protein
VVEAPRPEGLVEGNRYDTSVAAEIITNKNGYHLPIYRQQDQFAGSGWTPGRSTLLNILVASAACIRPLVLSLREEVIASGLLGTDETRVTLLLPPEITPPRSPMALVRAHPWPTAGVPITRSTAGICGYRFNSRMASRSLSGSTRGT